MSLLLRVFNRLERAGKLNWLTDKLYLKVSFYLRTGRRLDLKNPKSFNEKLQWIKLYDRKPEYTRMVDKYEAKEYVAEKIGQQYIIPTIGVWDRFDDIDFDKLPDQFVLKCTHDSGGLVICKNKSKFDIEAARKKITKSLNRQYYYFGREWPYKDVKPRIIAEKYMEDSLDGELRDYKFYCFSGEVKMFLIVTDRGEGTTRGDYFDVSRNHMDMLWGFPNAEKTPDFPKNLDEMYRLAEKLSEGIPHVRVDFYSVNGRIYFGELTFFDGSGMQKIQPYEKDLMLGSWLSLPAK